MLEWLIDHYDVSDFINQMIIIFLVTVGMLNVRFQWKKRRYYY